MRSPRADPADRFADKSHMDFVAFVDVDLQIAEFEGHFRPGSSTFLPDFYNHTQLGCRNMLMSISVQSQRRIL